MTPEKLVIDADPGVGDAVAIALALADSNLDVLGLTACAGHVSGERAFQHLQTVVSMVDPPRWPRLGHSHASQVLIVDDPDKSGIVQQNSRTMLGECPPVDAPLHQPTESHKLLADLVREYPGQITLLALGPLTNLQLAMERWPEFLAQLKSLICLGGSVTAPGDATAIAEFNIFADPESARTILTSPATKTLVPLDTSRQAVLSFDQYGALHVDEYSRLGCLLSRTLPFALREARNRMGREELELRAVVALAAVAHPELFEREAMTIDVERSGELTRGMTVFDRRGIDRWESNIDVLTSVDAHGVMDYMIRLIQAAKVN